MSEVEYGDQAQLLIGLTAGAKVDITDSLRVSTPLQYQFVTDTAPGQAGRGVSGTQLGRHRIYTHSFSCEADETTDPLFRRQTARRLFGTLRERGEGSGRPQAVYQGVARCSLTISKVSNLTIWVVQVTIDGIPDETAQA